MSRGIGHPLQDGVLLRDGCSGDRGNKSGFATAHHGVALPDMFPTTSPVTPPLLATRLPPSASTSVGLAHLAARLELLRGTITDTLDRRPCLVSAYGVRICDVERNHHPSCSLSSRHVALSLRWEAPVDVRLEGLSRRLDTLRQYIISKYTSAEDAAVEAVPHDRFFDLAVGPSLRCWAPSAADRAAARLRAATQPAWEGDLHVDNNVFALVGRLVEWDASGQEIRTAERRAPQAGPPQTAGKGSSDIDSLVCSPGGAAVVAVAAKAGADATGVTPAKQPPQPAELEVADRPPPDRPPAPRLSTAGHPLPAAPTVSAVLPRRLNSCGRVLLSEVRSRVAAGACSKTVLRLKGADSDAEMSLRPFVNWLSARNRALRSRVILADKEAYDLYILPACAWTAGWLGVDCSGGPTSGAPAVATLFCVAVRHREEPR